MYCSQCGAATSTTANFCRNCGSELVTEHSIEPNQETAALQSKIIKVPEYSEVNQSQASMGEVAHHPWRRLFARTIDLMLFGALSLLLLIFILYQLFPYSVYEYTYLLDNTITAGIVLYLSWIPVEAAFLATTGTTPSKWVFGIRVVSASGNKLSYGVAFKRTILLWIQGEGLGIPLVALLTRIFAYRRLMSSGTTLWDKSVDSVVTYKKWGVIRTLASIAIVFIALMFIVTLNAIGNM